MCRPIVILSFCCYGFTSFRQKNAYRHTQGANKNKNNLLFKVRKLINKSFNIHVNKLFAYKYSIRSLVG